MRRAPTVDTYERLDEEGRAKAARLVKLQAAQITAQISAEVTATREARAIVAERRRIAAEERRLLESQRRAIAAERLRTEERAQTRARSAAARAGRVEGAAHWAAFSAPLADQIRERARHQYGDTPSVTAQRCRDLEAATTTRRQDAAA